MERKKEKRVREKGGERGSAKSERKRTWMQKWRQGERLLQGMDGVRHRERSSTAGESGGWTEERASRRGNRQREL